MRIAVLSGKGGAGKTFVSVNLACCADKAVYVDCDVEEPNGRLFIKPEDVKKYDVCKSLPFFISDKCTGCRKCVDSCRFNALVFLRKNPMLFEDICHSCGLCSLVCPAGAVGEIKKSVGTMEVGHKGSLTSITGILNLGEASGIPVIKRCLEEAFKYDSTVIIDAPPGSACSVMESVQSSDFCVLVAEPTAFGFHNFKMVYELVSLLGKKCGVIINKSDEPYEMLNSFCREKNIPILMDIPYSKETAGILAEGKIASEEKEDLKESFTSVLNKIGGMM